MNGRRVALLLCLLCALGSAFSATGASAASKGTTEFTCKKKAVEGGVGFSREHCRSADAVGTAAKYEHLAVAEEEKTYVRTTNLKTASETTAASTLKLQGTVSGVVFEVQATTVEGEGVGRNSKDPLGEHYFRGTQMLVVKGATVTKPAGKSCKVVEGVISANRLALTTTGQGDKIKFQSATGLPFASFQVEGCSVGVLNGNYEVKGTVTGTPDGATIGFTHANTTEQGTLTMKGVKAGLEASLTVSGGEPVYDGLSLTTSETTKGTTAFDCAKTASGGAGFSKAHCRPEDAVASGATYQHTGLASSTGVDATATNGGTGAGTNESTPTKLKATIAGVVTELQATGVLGEGWVENGVDESGEHFSRGSGSLVYTGVTVTQPAGKGCKVFEDLGVKGTEGRVVTEALEATTTGQGDFLKLSPLEGEVLARFVLEGCSVEALNGTYEVKGSVKGVPNGATVDFTHANTTEQGTLLLNGVKAGLEGSVTLKVLTPSEGPFTPLSPTTVETP